MKRIKLGIAATMVALVATISLTGCTATSAEQMGSTAGTTQTQSVQTIQAAATAKLKEEDLNTAWDDSATKITLSGADISVEGSGAEVSGKVVTITKAGTYLVSGSLTDGQIAVSATKDDLVHLILNGASITNSTGAALYASQCDKLVITLVDGTTNSLTDGGSNYQYALEADQEPNATLFSKDDLTINGDGSLTVNAAFHNGIGTKDDLLIVSGSIAVNAQNHAVRGNDSVTIAGGSLNLTAGSDGIQTNNADDADKGYVLIEGGQLVITAGNDGVQADQALTVTGGTITITAGSNSSGTTDSYKGLKSAGSLTIAGGTINITSQDDSVHANGSILISGGTLTLSTGDDGVHADVNLDITGGKIAVTQSYEGLEAANISISGGDISIVASDDGINAAGGMDGSGIGGRFGGRGRDMFGGSTGNYSINVSGGTINLLAGGDGFDSNGSIAISGGEIISLIQSSGDNEAMDCDGTFSITGGTVIYGGTGAGSAPSDQGYVYTGTSISAGAQVSLVKDGQTVVSFTPQLNCQYLIMTSPEIVNGQSYTVTANGSQIATATAGTGGGSRFGGPGGGGGGGRDRKGW